MSPLRPLCPSSDARNLHSPLPLWAKTFLSVFPLFFFEIFQERYNLTLSYEFRPLGALYLGAFFLTSSFPHQHKLLPQWISSLRSLLQSYWSPPDSYRRGDLVFPGFPPLIRSPRSFVFHCFPPRPPFAESFREVFVPGCLQSHLSVNVLCG